MHRLRKKVNIIIVLLFILVCPKLIFAQSKETIDSLKMDSINQKREEMLKKQVDIADLYDKIFHPHSIDSTKKKSGITIIPNIAANPTIGFQGGIKAVAGRVLGHIPGTFMSVAATSASATTKGILYFYIVHNVFTPGNKWNFQGSLVASKSVTPDFGIGIGQGKNYSGLDKIMTDPERKPYVWHSIFYNFREKVYREVKKNLFVGAGVEFDIRKNITNPNAVPETETPYGIYNQKYGYDSAKNNANGFLFNVEYTTRDNINRAYKGMYLDVGLRINQKWIGSSKNAALFVGDFRKYVSLSKKSPETVLAFWTWGSSVLSGSVPYLELSGTGRDPNFRSGRGYVVGYFRGTQYFYSESEFRFPITRNKLLSGVTFISAQTTNDLVETKIFQVWQPAYGAGLRVLFNKATRTNLCLDYAFGKYGSKGFFLGLNEAF